MFLGSIGAYLAIRYSKEYKIANQYVNLANFVIPAIVFFVLILITGKSFIIKPELMLLIVLFSVFGTYVATNVGLKAIKLSSNPGLSLIIQKSYAVFTAIAAFYLFGSELTIKNFVAIVVIVIFVIVMSYEKPAKESQNKSTFIQKYWWLILSIIAGLMWGSNALFAKYMIIQGVDIYVRLFYVCFFASIISFVELFRSKATLQLNITSFVTLFSVGIGFTFFYIFMQRAYETAPNVGYVNIINTSSIAALTFISAFLFKDKLSLQKIIGVIGISFGVIIILI
jgi:drug/metabolite transporter (DMT)-like permease